jgi:hypothetical protein
MYLMCGIFAAIGAWSLWCEPSRWGEVLILLLPFAFLAWFLRQRFTL